MTFKDLIYDISEENNIDINELNPDNGSETHYCMQIQGENICMEGHAIGIDEENLFIFYVFVGIVIPEKKIKDISWILMQRNYVLKCAKWYIDPDSKILTVRAEQYLDGDEEMKKERIMEIIQNCGMIADADFPVVAKLI